MTDNIDRLSQLQSAGLEARELLTELRGTIKDAKAAHKETQELLARLLPNAVAWVITHLIDEQVKELLGAFKNETDSLQLRIAARADTIMAKLEEREKDLLHMMNDVKAVYDFIETQQTE